MLTFVQFLEREDKTSIERTSRIAENMFEQLKVYYSNIFVVYFPKPKEVDDHEKFMNWRERCRRYEWNLPQYEGRKFSIQGEKGNLAGEYLDDRVYLYDGKFSELHQDLRDWHFNFEYNLRADYGNSNARKNSGIKKDAKLVHEKMMQRMEEKRDDYLSSLFHEIVHLLDHIRMGERFRKVTDNSSSQLTKTVNEKPRKLRTKDWFNRVYYRLYMNNDSETNAYFLANTRKAFRSEFSSFEELLQDYKSHFGDYWTFLSKENQRRMIKRLYQVYSGTS